jgi:hypothetical protein
MSLNSDVLSRLPHVEGVFNYLTPMAEKPRNFTYDPPPGVARTNAAYEPHSMHVYDARPIAYELSVDGEGIQLVEHRSAVRGFHDEEEIRQVYYPEAERLVASATGAHRVVVFDHTIRRRLAGAVDRSAGTPRQPVTRVHNDYTEISGPQRVRDLMGDEAEELLKHRFAEINVWRPIRGPLLRSPLALCDAQTLSEENLVASDLRYPDRTGETYAVTFNPGQRWYYFPKMEADEVVLIRCFDSAQQGPARFSAHGAFDHPQTPPDAPPRESIEVRTLVFF